MIFRLALQLACVAFSASASFAMNLDRSTISEVIKDVAVIDATSKSKKPARVQEVFATPNILRTGMESRAEMVADDQTVTRVGANSLFSFEPNKREINLLQGSVLFNTPHGKGGGTIRTAAATASVLGTTIIVVTTKNGGFKVLLVEGRGRVQMPNGSQRIINAGQMVYVLPGQKFGPVYNFQIREQVAGSRLIRGFTKPLPSLDKIFAAIRVQEAAFSKGRLLRTGLLAGDSPDVAYQVSGGTRETAVKEDQSSSRFRLALSHDAIITDSKLDAAFIFPFDDPGLPERPAGGIGEGGSGAIFLSRNTGISSPSLDLTNFGAKSFVFLSINDLHFNSRLNIDGAPGADLSFIAGGTILNTPKTFVSANNARTRMIAFGSAFDFSFKPADDSLFSDTKPLQLTDFALRNAGGDIEVIAPSIHLANAGFIAAGDLSIDSKGSIRISDSYTANPKFTGRTSPSGSDFPVEQPVADTTFSPSGTALTAGGLLSIRATKAFIAQRSDLVAEEIRIAAGDAIVAREVRFSNRDFSTGRGIVNLQAGSLISITTARFNATSVSMKADTINLNDVSFSGSSRVVLDSKIGQLNNGEGTTKSGYVNFNGIIRHGLQNGDNAVIPESQPGPGIVIK